MGLSAFLQSLYRSIKCFSTDICLELVCVLTLDFPTACHVGGLCLFGVGFGFCLTPHTTSVSLFNFITCIVGTPPAPTTHLPCPLENLKHHMSAECPVGVILQLQPSFSAVFVVNLTSSNKVRTDCNSASITGVHLLQIPAGFYEGGFCVSATVGLERVVQVNQSHLWRTLSHSS